MYRASDYFQGEIKLKNIVVSKILGSFLSFIEFNNIRYWDIRENIDIKVYFVVDWFSRLKLRSSCKVLRFTEKTESYLERVNSV